MKKLLQKLSIRAQLFLFIIPTIVLIVGINSCVNYKRSSELLLQREQQKKENIKEGVKEFVDNYDLSLQLLEKDIEERIYALYDSIDKLHISNIEEADLNALRQKLGMDFDSEDLYIINRNGIISNTTKTTDLGLNLFGFGDTYKEFLHHVWLKKKIIIERIATENYSNKPKKYAYLAINENSILEIGIQINDIELIINDFSAKIKKLSNRYSNIESIDLFGATEALRGRNKNAEIADIYKDIAILTYENKKDTTITELNGTTRYIDLMFLEMREAEYFKGYVLQIVSNSSLLDTLTNQEFKRFVILMLYSLLITVLLIMLITYKITKPLNVLTSKVAEMSRTNMLKEVKIVGNSNTTKLSNEFNILTNQINGFQHALERKIDERTEELNGKNVELEKLLLERNVLFKETHHRIKNNLQIIASLLRLQSNSVVTKEAKEAFKNSVGRVQAMALLHEKLHQNSNYISIEANNYLSEIVELFQDSTNTQVDIQLEETNINLSSSQAISIGLIFNEFMTNSLKHAFEGVEMPIIKIQLKEKNKKITFCLFNNGKELAQKEDGEEKESLGMIIIDSFTDKLNGEYRFQTVEGGVELKITFPTVDLEIK